MAKFKERIKGTLIPIIEELPSGHYRIKRWVKHDD